jgi:hypothetical protein
MLIFSHLFASELLPDVIFKSFGMRGVFHFTSINIQSLFACGFSRVALEILTRNSIIAI